MSIVVCGFPGIGKSFFWNNHQDDYQVMDSDSSKYSWLSPGNRNSEFPDNYIRNIEKYIDLEDTVQLVSSHKIVRDALTKHKIFHYVVYPDKMLKEDYLARYILRGSQPEFIHLISDNWEKWIDEIENEGNHPYQFPVKLTEEKPFLKDVIYDIINWN